jgi:hypothetical protein
MFEKHLAQLSVRTLDVRRNDWANTRINTEVVDIELNTN